VDTPTGPLTATRPPNAAPGAAPYRLGSARRRRPAVLALAIALVAAGGLGGGVLYTATGTRVGVIALARDVPAGQAITRDDLAEARISLDPALHPLSVNSKVIGMRATADLKAGSLLTGADLTNDPLVLPDQQVVGLSAKAAQLPAARLHAGSLVVIVSTPAANGGADSGAAATGPATPTLTAITVRVVDVGAPDSDGNIVVDVAAPAAQGAALANLAAGGRFAVLIAAKGSG
jgi:hypothetical protein